MSDPANMIETATIRFDGSTRGPDDQGIELFVVETAQGSFWFEVAYEFAENGNDFRVTVRNFGLHRKSAAGSATPLVRRRFSAAESHVAQDTLRRLFIGPKDNPALPFGFHMAKSRCLGVNFPDGWITVV